MASLDDLKTAVKDALESRGVLDELRARVRAEIFDAIDDKEVVRPGRQADSALIDALVREYLEYNACRHTAAVFAAETGRRDDAPEFSREALAAQLRVADTTVSAQVPLLYALIAEARAPRPRGAHEEGGGHYAAVRGSVAAPLRAAAAASGGDYGGARPSPSPLMTFTN